MTGELGRCGCVCERCLLAPAAEPISPRAFFSEGMRTGRRFRVCPPANDLAMGGGGGKTGGEVSSMYSYIQLPHVSSLRAFPIDSQMG